MGTKEKNIERFEKLMGTVDRAGRDELMTYIREKSDFYDAPASTRFHLACNGGLLQHSLNVYDCLLAKKDNPVWRKALADIPEDSLIIVALLHDLCKIKYYIEGTRNQKTYEVEKVAAAEKWQVKQDIGGSYIWETVRCYEIQDKMPLGHGEKSVMLINNFMKLNMREICAIRWHMGFSEEKSQYKMIGEAMEKYPIVLALHEADLEASKLLESVEGDRCDNEK